jgi:hypothetical protein
LNEEIENLGVGFLQFVEKPYSWRRRTGRPADRAAIRSVGPQQSLDRILALILGKIEATHATVTEQMPGCQEDEFGFSGARRTNRQQNTLRPISASEPQLTTNEYGRSFAKDVILPSQVGTEVSF